MGSQGFPTQHPAQRHTEGYAGSRLLTPYLRNTEKPRSDKLLSDQDLQSGRWDMNPRPLVAKHTEAAKQPQVHPIVTQGDGKNDIVSVFRRIPGVGAVLGAMHVIGYAWRKTFMSSDTCVVLHSCRPM
jgi:hypothetical protein